MLHKTLKVCQVDCPLIGNGTSLLIRVQYIFVARKSTKKKINENIEGWKGEATVAGWPHISRQLGLGIYARYAKYVRYIRYSFRCSQIHSFICRNPLQQKLTRIHILQGLAMGILGPTQPYLAKQVFSGITVIAIMTIYNFLAGGCAQSSDQLHMDRPSAWWLHGGDHHQRCLQVSWGGVARYVIVFLFHNFRRFICKPWQKLSFLALCLLLSGGFGLLVPLVSSFPLLLPALLGAGFFIGSYNTANNSLVVYMLGPDKWFWLFDVFCLLPIQVSSLYSKSPRLHICGIRVKYVWRSEKKLKDFLSGSLVVRPFFPEVNVNAICGRPGAQEDLVEEEVRSILTIIITMCQCQRSTVSIKGAWNAQLPGCEP